MHYAVYVPNFGPYGNPELLRDVAATAEQNGWDGFFLWDHLIAEPRPVDPWVALTAVACRTRSMKLGPMIVPLPRRRPWKVALEAASLDLVSRGRVVLGVGTGVPADYARFGEGGPATTRAAQLDEGVELLSRLMSGETVTHHGEYYDVDEVTLTATSTPIWTSGYWPRTTPVHGAQGAAGLFPILRDPASPVGVRPPTVEEVKGIRDDFLAAGGAPGADIALWSLGADEHVDIPAYEAAGVTWWMHNAWNTPPRELMAALVDGTYNYGS